MSEFSDFGRYSRSQKAGNFIISLFVIFGILLLWIPPVGIAILWVAYTTYQEDREK